MLRPSSLGTFLRFLLAIANVPSVQPSAFQFAKELVCHCCVWHDCVGCANKQTENITKMFERMNLIAIRNNLPFPVALPPFHSIWLAHVSVQ